MICFRFRWIAAIQIDCDTNVKASKIVKVMYFLNPPCKIQGKNW